jgi:hypothetical protein
MMFLSVLRLQISQPGQYLLFLLSTAVETRYHGRVNIVWTRQFAAVLHHQD